MVRQHCSFCLLEQFQRPQESHCGEHEGGGQEGSNESNMGGAVVATAVWRANSAIGFLCESVADAGPTIGTLKVEDGK